MYRISREIGSLAAALGGRDALVFTGGFGTVLETLMIWQLVQVHHLNGTPLMLVGQMWPGLVEGARTSMLSTDPPLANAEDMDIPQCVPNGEAAVALIRMHHAQWMKKNGESARQLRIR